MNEHLDVLQRALASLEEGRFSEAAASIEALGPGRDLAASALAAGARALALEADGNVDDAMPLMERAFFADVALPGLLLEIGLFFERNGRPVLAHHAMLALDALDPDRLPARSDHLRGGGWARHAPRYIRWRLTTGSTMTYPLVPVKQGLVERLGAPAAAMVLAGIEDGQTERVAAHVPLVPLLEHARGAGHDYDESIPAEPLVSQPPRVFGRAPEAPLTKRTRVLFTSVLDDIVVASRSNILLARDAALLDVQAEELARDPMLEVDPIVVARDKDHVFVTGPRHREPLPSFPEAIWLTGIHSVAFGHWLMEFLPKVWALMERPGFRDVPVLLDAKMPPQHEEALRLFTGPSQPFITLGPNQQVRVDRLWVASQIAYLAAGPRPNAPRDPASALHHEGFRRLLERAQAAVPTLDLAGLPSRLYLPRPEKQRRRLVNAEAVGATLARHGFHAIDFARIAFVDQLRHILAAEHVVGQDGSALLMTILGRPGLRIGGLAQPRLEEWEWYADACEALGQELTVIVGDLARAHPEYEWMSDYEISLGALEAYLAGI